MIQEEVLHFQDVEINGTRRLGTLSYLAGKVGPHLLNFFCVCHFELKRRLQIYITAPQKADVAVGGMVMFASVYRIADVARLHSSTLACIVPPPRSSTDLWATSQPFDYLVT